MNQTVRATLLTAGILTALSGPLANTTLARDLVGTPDNDSLRGTPEADRIEGLGGNDELFGFDGNDVLDGGDGNDEAFGGHGNDSIDGGPGDDFLDGREGEDTLTGGPGRDAFVYYASAENGADIITDFNTAEDIIALHGFAGADVTVRTEGSDTVIDLPGPEQITLRGVSEFDRDAILYDITGIVR
jgi:Ca2+-binding RTX toxin-like protein